MRNDPTTTSGPWTNDNDDDNDDDVECITLSVVIIGFLQCSMKKTPLGASYYAFNFCNSHTNFDFITKRVVYF